MPAPTAIPAGADVLHQRITACAQEIRAMKAKLGRLTKAIHERENHLCRLEASKALGRLSPLVDQNHEQ